MIDSDFYVIYGEEKTGDKLGIIVINNHRRLHLEATDAFEFTTWLMAFKTAIDNNGLKARVKRNFDSFAPDRPNNHVKLYNDGHDYFQDLYDKLIKAQKEIYITDWFMTPELYLKRPVNLDSDDMNKYRLDNIFGELAKNGVKIFILLWKEVEFAGLYNNSAHTKEMIAPKHANIKVLRHPRSLISFWSHHEKICVIDQKCAFLGGIDMCLGRYDFNSHPVKDLPDEHGRMFFPGADYNNARVKDFTQVEKYKECLVDREEIPRMPWHDIQVFVEGA